MTSGTLSILATFVVVRGPRSEGTFVLLLVVGLLGIVAGLGLGIWGLKDYLSAKAAFGVGLSLIAIILIILLALTFWNHGIPAAAG